MKPMQNHQKQKKTDKTNDSDEVIEILDDKMKEQNEEKKEKEEESKKKDKNCMFFNQNRCRFGISGKGCPFTHSKICKKFLKNGNDNRLGCNGVKISIQNSVKLQ